MKRSGKPNRFQNLYIKALKGRSEVLQHTGDAHGAIKDLTALLSYCKRSFGDLSLITEDVRLRMASAYTINRSAYDRAGQILHKALSKRAIEKSPDLLISALLYAGYLYHEKSDPKSALPYFSRALKHSKRINDWKQMMICYDYLGLIHRMLGDHDKSHKYHSKSLSISKKRGDKLGIGKSSNHLGLLAREKGDYDKALYFYSIHYQVSSEVGYKRGIGIAAGNMGVILVLKGELEKALEYYNIGFSTSAEIGEKKGVAIASNNLGTVFANKGELQRALEYFMKYLSISKEIGYMRGVGNAHFNIANICLESKRMMRAEKNYLKAQEIFKKIGDRPKLLMVYINHAEHYIVTKKRKKAVRMARDALKMSKELKARAHEIYALHVLAKALADESPEEAITYYQRMISRARLKGLSGELAKALLELSLILKRRGNEREARKYYKEAKELEKKTGIKLGR